MRRRRYLVLLLLFALALAQGTARAADTSGTPSTGGGIRLGEPLVLHLGLATEVGWDSNVFFENTNGTNAFYLRLNPSFDLTTRPRAASPPVQFDFHGGLGYIEFLTSDSAIEAHREFNVDAGILATFLAGRPYNFALFDNYVRTTMPPYTVASNNFNRDTNSLGLRATLSPGGGRLSFYVGYAFGIDYFEESPLTDFNLQSHTFDLRASWRFFPKTALYIAGQEIIYNYVQPGSAQHPDSYPLRIEAGVQGLITPKLTVNAWIGYGNGFYQWPAATMIPKVNPNTPIGGVGLTWKPTMLSTGAVGYTHDFVNSLLGAYYDEDLVYISWTQLIWRFTGFVRLQYTNMRFNGVQPIQATTNGTDNNLTLNVRVDYPFKDWLIGSVGYDLYYNNSNRTITGGTPAMPAAVPVDYTKNVVYLRISFQY